MLEAAGIADPSDMRVHGNDISDGGLCGKPAPDSFLEAAHRMRVEPAHGPMLTTRRMARGGRRKPGLNPFRRIFPMKRCAGRSMAWRDPGRLPNMVG